MTVVSRSHREASENAAVSNMSATQEDAVVLGTPDPSFPTVEPVTTGAPLEPATIPSSDPPASTAIPLLGGLSSIADGTSIGKYRS